MNDALKMQVSAFVDDELPENEADLLVRRLSQDFELRQQVADYLAIGRVMRRESGVAGVERLRDRISAELDERPSQDDADRAPANAPSRLLRPLTGVAVAATVALIAILGLRQTPGVGEIPDAVAGVGMDDAYTEPAPSDDMLQLYRLMHTEVASGFDANRFNPRLVTLQWLERAPVDEIADEEDLSATDAAEDSAAATRQPQ